MFDADEKLVEAELKEKGDVLSRVRRNAVVAVGAAAMLHGLWATHVARGEDRVVAAVSAQLALTGTMFLLLSFQTPQLALVCTAMMNVTIWAFQFFDAPDVARAGWPIRALALVALLIGIVRVFWPRRKA